MSNKSIILGLKPKSKRLKSNRKQLRLSLKPIKSLETTKFRKKNINKKWREAKIFLFPDRSLKFVLNTNSIFYSKKNIPNEFYFEKNKSISFCSF